MGLAADDGRLLLSGLRLPIMILANRAALSRRVNLCFHPAATPLGSRD